VVEALWKYCPRQCNALGACMCRFVHGVQDGVCDPQVHDQIMKTILFGENTIVQPDAITRGS
jgi:hypothetical protein